MFPMTFSIRSAFWPVSCKRYKPADAKGADPLAPSFRRDRLAFHGLEWHHLDSRLRDAEMRMANEHLRRLAAEFAWTI
jgi:hypothetical protein